jgi:hypothetical protein
MMNVNQEHGLARTEAKCAHVVTKQLSENNCGDRGEINQPQGGS